MVDLAVGARCDNDGGWDRGAVWVPFLDGVDARIAVNEFPLRDLNCDGVLSGVDIGPFFERLGTGG